MLAGMGVVGAIVILVVGTLIGVIIIGLGQVYLALREIALNTRAALSVEAVQNAPPYNSLKMIGSLMAFLGIIGIAGTIIIAGIMIVGSFNAESTRANAECRETCASTYNACALPCWSRAGSDQCEEQCQSARTTCRAACQ